MSKVSLKVLSRKDKTGTESHEGVVTFVGLNVKPTKLHKSDGTTVFTTKAQVTQNFRNMVKKGGFEVEEAVKVETPVKKAAKKAVPRKPKKVKEVETPPANWVAESN
jgi:hypothetical protein